MCLPFSKIFSRLQSKHRKPTLGEYIHKNFKPSTVDLASTAYSSTNVYFVKPSVDLKNSKVAAASLAEAFKDDEVARYFLTDAHRTSEQTWKLHTKILEYTVKAHCRKGLVLSIGENHEGVALW